MHFGMPVFQVAMFTINREERGLTCRQSSKTDLMKMKRNMLFPNGKISFSASEVVGRTKLSCSSDHSFCLLVPEEAPLHLWNLILHSISCVKFSCIILLPPNMASVNIEEKFMICASIFAISLVLARIYWVKKQPLLATFQAGEA